MDHPREARPDIGAAARRRWAGPTSEAAGDDTRSSHGTGAMTRTEPRPHGGDEPEAATPGAALTTSLQATGHAGVVTRILAACVDLGAVVLAAVLLDLGAAGVRF